MITAVESFLPAANKMCVLSMLQHLQQVTNYSKYSHVMLSSADLDGLASISQLVDFIKDDSVVLVALSHVCPCCQVDVLAKLLQDDLALTTSPVSPRAGALNSSCSHSALMSTTDDCWQILAVDGSCLGQTDLEHWPYWPNCS